MLSQPSMLPTSWEPTKCIDIGTLGKVQRLLFRILLCLIFMYSLTCSGCKNYRQTNIITASPNIKPLSTLCLNEPGQDVKTIPVRLEIDVIWLAVSLCLSSLDSRRSQHTVIKCNPHQPNLDWGRNSCNSGKLISAWMWREYFSALPKDNASITHE